MEAFAILFDVAVVAFVVWVARRLKARPNALDNWRPSEDDARSGRRVTLLIYPKRSRR